jgi:serine/threonine-protein kinase RsbW/sigma-B regulation protein RsbU (phosphoserine phosphatase)
MDMSQAAPLTTKRLNVPRTSEGVKEIARAFDAFSVSLRIGGPQAHAVQVALDEILSNTVRAGISGEEEGRIDVRFELVDDNLDILVVDDGEAFDPLSRPAPDTASPLEARPVGGLGIHLVRKLMDRVEYERREGTNRLRLGKRIISG